MDDILIPHAVLADASVDLSDALQDATDEPVSDQENTESSVALRYFTLLIHHPSLARENIKWTSDEVLFYNQYYWFVMYVRLHELNHGPNAGLEQQANQLLETTDIKINWSIVEEIEKRIDSEIQSR